MAEAADAEQSFPGAFCTTCNKWRDPGNLLPDGSCPRCRTQLDDHRPADLQGVPESDTGDAASDAVAAGQADKIPWHFWLMVAATVIYLGWRVIQGLQALF